MVPLSDIKTDMQVRVAAGGNIPVDGVVTAGTSQSEESKLTGEPGWIDKSPGSEVLAGSMNGEAEIIVRATSDGLQSNWILLCRQVRDALSQPTRTLIIADKVAAAFVPIVLLLSLVAIWVNHSGGEAEALMAGLAVLVVACPCALGLAAPLASSLSLIHI